MNISTFKSMTTEEHQKTLVEMTELANSIRGRILGIFTIFEVIMDDIIKKKLFSSEIEYNYYFELLNIHNLTMDTKKKIFKKIIENYQTEKSVDCSGILQDIDNLVEKRNILTHCPLDTRNETILEFFNATKERTIQFIKEEKGKQTFVSFNKAKVQKLDRTIHSITGQLAEIQREIIGSMQNDSK